VFLGFREEARSWITEGDSNRSSVSDPRFRSPLDIPGDFLARRHLESWQPRKQQT
jgi:hypothetical protein